MDYTPLISSYEKLTTEFEEVSNKAAHIKNNETLSRVGKDEALAKLRETARVDEYRQDTSLLLDEYVAQLSQEKADTTTALLTNADHQSALRAAIEAIRGGYITDDAELQAIANTFIGDELGLARLADAAKEQGVTSEVFKPKHPTKDLQKMLEQFKVGLWEVTTRAALDLNSAPYRMFTLRDHTSTLRRVGEQNA